MKTMVQWATVLTAVAAFVAVWVGMKTSKEAIEHARALKKEEAYIRLVSLSEEVHKNYSGSLTAARHAASWTAASYAPTPKERTDVQTFAILAYCYQVAHEGKPVHSLVAGEGTWFSGWAEDLFPDDASNILKRVKGLAGELPEAEKTALLAWLNETTPKDIKLATKGYVTLRRKLARQILSRTPQ